MLRIASRGASACEAAKDEALRVLCALNLVVSMPARLSIEIIQRLRVPALTV